MILFPNAKINLGLNVLRRRDDGYHDISTVMAPVDWCDILEIVPAQNNTDSLTCSGNIVNCPPEKNLVLKAIKVVRENSGKIIPPVDIFLHKNIPDGAGLGGGSADASFTIKGVNALFDLHLSAKEMEQLAAKIGCDCPFFIKNIPSEASERGDFLIPLEKKIHNLLKDFAVVIAKPEDISISTAEAYGAITPSEPQTEIKTALTYPSSTWRNYLYNDFEALVLNRSEKVRQIKQLMYTLGAEYASMSGSGSAVFGLFRKEKTDKGLIAKHLNGLNYHIGKFL